jgi:hypothetical protein
MREFLMSKAIPWREYVSLLDPRYKKAGKVGRDKKELEMMRKELAPAVWRIETSR